VKELYSTSRREKIILSYNGKRRKEEANYFQKHGDSSEPGQSFTVRLGITL